jgi:ankyrin repeat protein
LTELSGQRPRHLSCIHLAALHGHTDIVQFLVDDEGVDPNTLNNKDDTPVLWAARGNHIETVRKFIQYGADLQHQNDKGSTPLYWAVRYGFPELLKVWLSLTLCLSNFALSLIRTTPLSIFIST